MALVLGTNCGFVTTAPTEDPLGLNIGIENVAESMKAVAPAGAGKIVEIGFWIDSAYFVNDYNFEVGIYSHDAGSDAPLTLLGSNKTNSSGTTSGIWKSAVVDISITEGNTYWITVQSDSGSNLVTNYASMSDTDTADKNPATTLPDPTWDGSALDRDYARAFYAVWEAAPPPAGTNSFINIDDNFKPISNKFINIGDIWKPVATEYINIGDTWKKIF